MKRTGVTCLLASAAALSAACAGGEGDGGVPAPASPGALYEGTLRLDSGEVPIHYELRDGVAVWQDDIVLRPAELPAAEGLEPEGYTQGSRAAMFDAGLLWPNARIPFRFAPSISSSSRAQIVQAATRWNQHTNILFTFDATNSAVDYILFVDDGTGCHSPIGRTGGANVVAMGAGCGVAQAVHEIGHSVGLLHEMSRPDRDDFVTVKWDNICSGQASVPGGQQCAGHDRTGNFDKTSKNAVGPFDFSSMMLYPATTGDPTFALDTTKPIITRKDGSVYPNPQAAGQLSAGDLVAVAQLYPPISGRDDVNQDGKPDIFWHNESTGETQIWYMGGPSRVGRATVDAPADGGGAFVVAPWYVVGTNDFNQDGRPDILWHNESTGETQVWYMNGASRVGRATVNALDGGSAFVGAPWHIVATGDFNQNGKADILWHNESTGETQIWYMNGASRVGRATVNALDGGSAFVGAPWGIVSSNDFNQDGRPDILWHNESTGETQVWYMNGASRVGRATVNVLDGGSAFVVAPWHIVGTNDYDKDGKADILWHNESTGETQIWYMNGASRVARATVDAAADGGGAFVTAPWHIVNH